MGNSILAISFTAGLLTFLSPCILPMIPVYIANLTGASSLEQPKDHWRPFFHSLCFVMGFSIVFTALGATIGLVGGAIAGGPLRIVSGILLIAFGSFLIAAQRVSWLNYEIRLWRFSGRSTGYVRSILLGVAFSLGWTPCIGPLLGGILSTALATEGVWNGVYLLGSYSLGLGIPFIVVGFTMAKITPVLRWISRHGNIISLVSGLLLIFVGILVITNNLGFLQPG